jgi:hypothetical protein
MVGDHTGILSAVVFFFFFFFTSRVNADANANPIQSIACPCSNNTRFWTVSYCLKARMSAIPNPHLRLKSMIPDPNLGPYHTVARGLVVQNPPNSLICFSNPPPTPPLPFNLPSILAKCYLFLWFHNTLTVEWTFPSFLCWRDFVDTYTLGQPTVVVIQWPVHIAFLIHEQTLVKSQMCCRDFVDINTLGQPTAVVIQWPVHIAFHTHEGGRLKANGIRCYSCLSSMSSLQVELNTNPCKPL